MSLIFIVLAAKFDENANPPPPAGRREQCSSADCVWRARILVIDLIRRCAGARPASPLKNKGKAAAGHNTPEPRGDARSHISDAGY